MLRLSGINTSFFACHQQAAIVFKFISHSCSLFPCYCGLHRSTITANIRKFEGANLYGIPARFNQHLLLSVTSRPYSKHTSGVVLKGEGTYYQRITRTRQDAGLRGGYGLPTLPLRSLGDSTPPRGIHLVPWRHRRRLLLRRPPRCNRRRDASPNSRQPAAAPVSVDAPG